MEELKNILDRMLADPMSKIIISKPAEKDSKYKKIVIERKRDYFQSAKYTQKQVFHDNIEPGHLKDYLL